MPCTLTLMVSIHKQRAAHRARHEKPINVSVIVDGIVKVIPYEEYEEKYLNEVKEEVVDAPTEESASP